MMNRYGTLARRHWQQHLPNQYALIENPDDFFQTLGDQIQTEVEQRRDQIAGDDPPGEDYLAKLGRLNEATLTAQSDVLREMLPEPELEEPQTEE